MVQLKQRHRTKSVLQVMIYFNKVKCTTKNQDRNGFFIKMIGWEGNVFATAYFKQIRRGPRIRNGLIQKD